MLVFEALRDVMQSGAETVTPALTRRLRPRMRVLGEGAAMWFHGQYR